MTSVLLQTAQLEAVQLTQEEILAAWLNLLPNLLGIVVYLIFIFEFYRFVARRDVFELKLRRYSHGPISRGIAAIQNFLRVVFYILEYLFFYPILIIVWYLAFVALLTFLARDLPIETLLLIAMAVVSGIRVTAYYNEDLSRDLAKMLPLALLGVVVLEGATAISFERSLDLVLQIPTHWRRILTYLLFLIPLELVLRVTRIVVTGQLATVRPGDEEPDMD